MQLGSVKSSETAEIKLVNHQVVISKAYYVHTKKTICEPGAFRLNMV